MHLAALPPDHTATSESIAEHTLVPRGYLSKVLRDLVVAELIDSRRGPNGGFVLARPAGEITILDVVSAVDPLKRIDRCPLGNPMHVSLCPLHRRLDDAISMVEGEFRRTSLAELLDSAARAAGRCGRLTAPTIGNGE
jgi:Rrf2 family protein